MRKIFEFTYIWITTTEKYHICNDRLKGKTIPKISWLKIFEIQREDPPHLKTKASEKSINIKIKEEKTNNNFEGNSHPYHVVIPYIRSWKAWSCRVMSVCSEQYQRLSLNSSQADNAPQCKIHRLMFVGRSLKVPFGLVSISRNSF